MNYLGRKRQQTGLNLDEMLAFMVAIPVWAGPIFALTMYMLIAYVPPLLLRKPEGGPDFFQVLRPMFPMFAKLFTGLILFVWVVSLFVRLRNRLLLNSRSGVASLSDMTWREFEHLVSEAYRRQGFFVETGTGTNDGGIDIVMSRRGEKVLVQCKQWKTSQVGVSTIRELLGVVVSEKASKGIVVTSGQFTAEARRFAEKNGEIELLDGPALWDLIREVQPIPAGKSSAARSTTGSTPPAPPEEIPPPMACPACGSEMTIRIARKGPSAGSKFWGCTKYPECRHTLKIATTARN